MISIRRTLTWPKRRWRAGGFGIHSPFAFAFVTGALARKGAADSEAGLRDIADDDYHSLALLYRCVAYLKPKSVAICPAGDEKLIRTVQLAHPEAVITGADSPTPPDMTVVWRPEAAPERDNGATIYFISRIDKEPAKGLWKRLNDNCTHGMDFTDRRTGIICRFSHLPRQSFKIVFK